MRDWAFSFEGVSMWFGRTAALQELTLAVPRGSVVGLLGRNGAGKSTALRCLVGLQRPTAGEVRALGVDPWDMPIPLKQRLGYASERGVPFSGVSARQLVGMCAPLYQSWDERLEGEILERFQIDPRAKLRTLSLGQQRAVGLLLALCPRPNLLVLDEPAANLDPVVRREFLDQVIDLVADEGRTVLFSSHNLSDVERVADRVVFIEQGRLLLDRQMDHLKEQVRRLRLVFPGEAPRWVPTPGLLAQRRAGRELVVTVDDFYDGLTAELARATGAHVEAHALSLEELFLDLVGDRAVRRAA